MDENKDPIACIACGTVNPWMNDTCRSCGVTLSRPAQDEDTPVDDSSESQVGDIDSGAGKAEPLSEPLRHPSGDREQSEAAATAASRSKPRWNVLWICIGIAVYIGVVAIGEFMVARFVIAPEPRLRAIIEETQSGAAEISESDQKELRSLLFGNPVFLVLVAILLIGAPFLIAVAVGYFTQGLREGAAALGLAVFILCLVERQIKIGLVVGIVYVGLGLVGAMTGNWLRQKHRPNQS